MPKLKNVKLHIETHHPGNFKCNKCLSKCTNTNALHKHKTNHHPTPKTKSNRVRSKTTFIKKCRHTGTSALAALYQTARDATTAGTKLPTRDKTSSDKGAKPGGAGKAPPTGRGRGATP